MPRARTLIPVAVVLLQLAVVVTLVLAPPRDSPHEAPITLIGPPVVSTTFVDRLNALDGRPLSATAGTTADEAEREVRDGVVVAAVIIDLAREHDVLYLNGANGEHLNDALRREAESITASLDRTIDVVDVAPNATDRHVSYLVTLASLVTGFAVALVLYWRRVAATPHHTDTRRLRRLAIGLLAVALTLAAAGTVYTAAGWAALVLLTTTCATAFTGALARFAGPWGHGFAASLFVLTSAPLIRASHPLMLPGPWAEITPWLPHGAALDIAMHLAHFDGPGSPRSWALLTAYTAVSLFALALIDREVGRSEA